MDNIGYGRKRLKDIIEKEAEEEEVTVQQQDDEQYDTVPKDKIGVRRNTRKRIRADWKFK